MKPVIPVGAVSLRPVVPGDAVRMEAILTAPKVRRFLCDDTILTSEDITAFIQESVKQDDEGLGYWVIEASTGSVTGIVGLTPVLGPLVSDPRMAGRIEPTVALDPAFWGQGIAHLAMSGVIEHARGDLALPELVAAVDAPNEQSHRMLKACGFRAFGKTTGNAHDLILYSLPLKTRVATEG